MPWTDGRESNLLAEARQGDTQAFVELIEPSAEAVYRRARRVTGNSADAEDVRQETLLKAYTRLGQFAGYQKNELEFRAWVSRIGTNTSIDFLRRRSKMKAQPLEWESESTDTSQPREFVAAGENPEEHFAKRELCALISKAILTLDPELRRVCLLRDVLEYSTQEVADRLEISQLAVRLRLYRAHVKLREKMQQARSKKSVRRIARGVTAPQPRPFAALQQCCCGD